MTLAERIRAKFPNLIESFSDEKEPTVYVKKEGVKDVMLHLRNDAECAFDFLMDLFAVDYLFWEDKEKRFEVVYNLYSSKFKQRIFVKVRVAETDAAVDSITPIWPAANWYEREVWDMFGIRFGGHPDPRRILMYEGFEGHALRKDYPYNKRQPLVGPVN